MEATTTKAAHTPGPWEAHGPHIECGKDLVAFVDRKAPMPWEANARLIAAAPELLKALQAIILDSDKLPESQFRLAAAAIAKAIGDA